MRLHRLSAALLALGVLTIASPARAQERGDVGISMGFPGAIGLPYHITDRLAIRPELSLSFASSSSDDEIALLTSESSTVGVGVSGIFYLHRWDKLRTYVSPRYSYIWSKSTSESIFSGESEGKIRSHAFTAVFGTQYALHDHFSVFGEVGAGVTSQHSSSSQGVVTVNTDSFSTRTAVGAIFYF
jgi:opacity protein-like surface antigen